MAKIIYDKNLSVDIPTLLLKKKDFTNIGTIIASDINHKVQFNSANELSFKVYKFSNQELNKLWDEINDYNIIHIPEYNECFEMRVSLNEETGIYKDVSCKTLAESELSQTKLYDIEINTEDDIARPDYDKKYPTIFYRDLSEYEEGSEMYKKLYNSSLLHRILDKASNYTIAHVDESLKKLKEWYTFSISDSNIYDELTSEIAEQYQCLFLFDSVNRTISAYDLCNTCDDCGYRGDFHDKCPECNSTNFSGAYGKDTSIFVSKDNLSTSASIESNKDSLKNCFRICGGDDLMTAAVSMCNPNGSNYIYYFSEETLASMPESLVAAITNYNATYNDYLNNKIYTIPSDVANNYNNVINTLKNLYPDNNYSTITTSIKGYKKIPTLAYEILDLILQLEHGMCKTPDINGESIEDTMNKLTVPNLSPIAVTYPTSTSNSSVDNAVISMCKVFINTALYRVSIEESTYIPGTTGKWTGKFKLTSIEDTSQTLVSAGAITLDVTSDEETYLKQKLKKKLSQADEQVKPLCKMIFENDYTDNTFKSELQYYSLSYLTNLKETFDDARSVIWESNNDELKNKYNPLFNRCVGYIVQEMKKNREKQISVVKKLYYYGSDDNPYEIGGILYDFMYDTKNSLDFEKYLGNDLWKVFCSYRREDKYQNDNYISDGLDNSKLMNRASKLIETAYKELYKAGNMQYNVTSSLNNLLALKEFQPIVDDFECGNWIHLGVDEKIYYLRLLSYSINFDDLSKIDIEFSTVEKIWSGISDVESIMSSASSIAGSYSATISQVKNSAASSQYVDNWVQKGLDATATKIVNNADNQSIVIDRSGIVCREYDDIEDAYSECQSKLINNGLYITDDNWNTVKAAIGKYIYTDPVTRKEKLAYGIIGETIVGKFLLSEYLGIYSKDGSVIIDGSGITLDGGKITWISPIASSAVEGLDEYKSSVSDCLGVTTIASDSVISPKIEGGYLYIAGKNGSVEINPKLITGYEGRSGDIFNIKNSSDNSVFRVNTSGQVHISGGNSYSSIDLDGVNGSIYTYKGNRKTVLASGYLDSTDGTYSARLSNAGLYFSKDNIDYALFHSTCWKGTDIRGVGVNSYADSKFISFGNKNDDSEDSFTTQFVLNYGLNPNGITQNVLIYGSTYFGGNIHFKNGDYLSTLEDGGIYCSGKFNTSGAISVGNFDPGNYKLYVGGHAYIQNDLKVSGKLYATHDFKKHDFTMTSNNNFVTGVSNAQGTPINLASVEWVQDNYQKKSCDERIKTNFDILPKNIDIIFDEFFVQQYEYMDGINYKKGIQFGDTAQHIEKIFNSNGLNIANYGIIGKRNVDYESGENKYIKDDYFHYIDQNNVLWLCVDQLQKTKKRVSILEKEKEQLKQKLTKLESAMNQLCS